MSRMLEGPGTGPIEQTPIYGKVRSLLDDWCTLRRQAESRSASTLRLHGRIGKSASPQAAPRDARPEAGDLTPRTGSSRRPDRCGTSSRTSRSCRGGSRRPRARSRSRTRSDGGLTPLRQSQLVTTYGPGAMIDLPWFAAVVGGLDFWDKGGDDLRAPPGGEGRQGRSAVSPVDAGGPARQRQAARRDDHERASMAWRFPGWSITQETRRAGEPDGRTYRTRCSSAEAHLDEKTGHYKGTDFDDRPGKDELRRPDPFHPRLQERPHGRHRLVLFRPSGTHELRRQPLARRSGCHAAN